MAERGAVCVLAEPSADPGLLDAVIQGGGGRIATADPLGTGLNLGPTLCPGLIRGLANALVECLSEEG